MAQANEPIKAFLVLGDDQMLVPILDQRPKLVGFELVQRIFRKKALTPRRR